MGTPAAGGGVFVLKDDFLREVILVRGEDSCKSPPLIILLILRLEDRGEGVESTLLEEETVEDRLVLRVLRLLCVRLRFSCFLLFLGFLNQLKKVLEAARSGGG